jgi:hypothetical protein
MKKGQMGRESEKNREGDKERERERERENNRQKERRIITEAPPVQLPTSIVICFASSNSTPR